MNNEQKLISIFKNTFAELGDRDDKFITGCSKGDVYSWDSGNQFMLITCIEEDFAISLPNEAIAEIASFLDAYRVIEELLE